MQKEDTSTSSMSGTDRCLTTKETWTYLRNKCPAVCSKEKCVKSTQETFIIPSTYKLLTTNGQEEAMAYCKRNRLFGRWTELFRRTKTILRDINDCVRKRRC